MRTLQTAALFASAGGAALMAGLFCAFAYAVMPGLSRSDDQAFVRSMQNINGVIINGWFLIPFLAPLPLLVLATVLAARGDSPGTLPWIAAALVLHGLAFLVTGTRNVPLNEALGKVGKDSTPDQLGSARAAFEAPGPGGTSSVPLSIRRPWGRCCRRSICMARRWVPRSARRCVRRNRQVRHLGFRHEGIPTDHLCIGGAWRDHERWSMTAPSPWAPDPFRPEV